MNILIILMLYFQLSTAATPSSNQTQKKEVKDTPQDSREAQKQEEGMPSPHKKKDVAFPKGPYKNGIYQYEWEKDKEQEVP